MQCNAKQCNAMQCSAMQRNATKYDTHIHTAQTMTYTTYNTKRKVNAASMQLNTCNKTWSAIPVQYTNTIQHNTTQHNTKYNTTTLTCNTIQYNTIQYHTIQYNTTQHNTTQYNTIQYNQYNNEILRRYVRMTMQYDRKRNKTAQPHGNVARLPLALSCTTRSPYPGREKRCRFHVVHAAGAARMLAAVSCTKPAVANWQCHFVHRGREEACHGFVHETCCGQWLLRAPRHRSAARFGQRLPIDSDSGPLSRPSS